MYCLLCFLLIFFGIWSDVYAQKETSDASVKNKIASERMVVPFGASLLCGSDHYTRTMDKTLFVATCSGKCGSSTLVASFQALGIESWQVHQIFPDRPLQIYNKAKIPLVMAQDIPGYADTILFIDSYRDIISRKIAAFFQHLESHAQMSGEEIQAKCHQEGVDFLIKNLNAKIVSLEQYYGSESWLQYGYDYLKDEVFSMNNKYQLKNIDNMYFINLRYSDIDEWQKIIKSIPLPIDLSRFRIISRNIGKKKWYATIYVEFLEKFTLSQSDFDAILRDNQEEIMHFYGEQGIQDFIERWLPKIS